MIANKKQAWREAMSNLITDPQELLHLLQLDPTLLPSAQAAAKLFPLRVTHSFVQRMEIGNPDDPLLKQVLPLGAELTTVPGFSNDPLGEQPVNVLPGLLHKYAGRVLVTPTSACAVHCRYCFRRSFPYEDNNPGREGWLAIMDYIAKDPSIWEVILSGGDPLTLNDAMLQQFTDLLKSNTHIKCLRIHTRLPIVLPERITEEFIHWASALPFKLVIVLHTNHPNEIDEVTAAMLQRLRPIATLLNQSVLLKDINDDADVLAELSKKLFEVGVLPYYLHVLDKVQGAAHFDLPLSTATLLHQELMNKLPGYLVPRLVREDAGAEAKTLLSGGQSFTSSL